MRGQGMKMLTFPHMLYLHRNRMLWSQCLLLGLIAIGVFMLTACAGLATEKDDQNVAVVDDGVAVNAQTGMSATANMKDGRSRTLRSLTSGWKTDWTRHAISYDELRWGGPKRDEIPSIDAPHFISNAQAASWLVDNEPVIVVDLQGEARAYPLQIMIWHEIVNDMIGNVPILVTFCPLCNSAIVFDRRVENVTYEFGTSGLLRNSDLVMYDRTNESLWQQFTGEAIVGDAMGHHLSFFSSSVVSFGNFREAYPSGMVLSTKTGLNRTYGRNPYANYDTIGNKPFLFNGKVDARLQAMERVVSVSLGEVEVAYPLTVLVEHGVVNDTQAGRYLAVFHGSGTSSALDASQIAKGRDVGATGVFDATVNGQTLTFRQDGNGIVDQETGTRWNIFGHGVSGSLQGTQLTPIVHGDHFWFSWAAFKPKTIVFQGK